MSRLSALRSSSSFLGILFALLLLMAAFASAQAGRPDVFDTVNSTTYGTQGPESHGGTIVQVHVFSEDGKTHLDRQSVIKATNQTANTVNWLTTDDHSQATFELPFVRYDVEVSAVGYFSQTKTIQAVGAVQHVQVEVI